MSIRVLWAAVDLLTWADHVVGNKAMGPSWVQSGSFVVCLMVTGQV